MFVTFVDVVVAVFVVLFVAFVVRHLLLFSPPIRFVSSVVTLATAVAIAVVVVVVVALFYCLTKPVEHLFTHLCAL